MRWSGTVKYTVSYRTNNMTNTWSVNVNVMHFRDNGKEATLVPRTLPKKIVSNLTWIKTSPGMTP